VCRPPLCDRLLNSADIFFPFLTARAGSSTEAIIYISICLFLLYIVSSAAWAMASVAIATEVTASVGSIQNIGGYLGGACAPTVTGFIVQATGSFKSALYVGAGVALLSALMHLVLVKVPEKK
jgi:nitrate/nitrite transporter NarK